MLSKEVQSIFNTIAVSAGNLVAMHVNPKDLTGKVDFASIYAQSENEYSEIAAELNKNGVISDTQTTGNYFLLNIPLQTSIGIIRHCRIRTFDLDHKERGYCDFEVVNYAKFKNTFLQKPLFTLINNQHGIEMVELRDPKFNVRAYFPNVKF